MPSVEVDLGKFVTVRRRADGTARVLFEIPPRLRPDGWLPTHPLPIEGKRTGNLADAGEVARIREDAERLYGDYLSAKKNLPQRRSRGRSILDLVECWHGSIAFRRITPRTKKSYDFFTKIILSWSESLGHPDPSRMTKANVEAFLALYDDRRPTQHRLRSVMKLILDQKAALGWGGDNPASGIPTSEGESKVTIWEPADVDRMTKACIAASQPGLAALIHIQWEIGQRMTDALSFQYGNQYVDGAFRFWQSKTDSYVTIPVSDHAIRVIESCRRNRDNFLIVDSITSAPFTDQTAGDTFRRIFNQQREVGTSRRLVLRALRHSCVVQLARHGATVPEIASITGHSLRSVETILAHYLPRDNEVAWNAQRKRGLIGPKADV